MVVKKQVEANEGDIVVALVDNQNTLKRYFRDDENKNRFGFIGEIKGSELMTQRNNEALKYFITNVLDDKHFLLCERVFIYRVSFHEIQK